MENKNQLDLEAIKRAEEAYFEEQKTLTPEQKKEQEEQAKKLLEESQEEYKEQRENPETAPFWDKLDSDTGTD